MDRYVLDGVSPPFAIPTTLHASLLARLDRLASVRLVAQTGAAIGREFSYPLLRDISPLSDEELQSALGQLVASELVFQRGTPPEAVYAFKHALVQDAAYGTLLPLLQEGLAAYRATEAMVFVPFFLTLLADARGKGQHRDEAGVHLAEAECLLAETDERWAEAELYRVRGELLCADGDSITAEVWFRKAVSVARQQGAKFWELRASTSLARLWRDQGKPDDARDLLAPVYGWFTEGFDTPDLKEAKALLDALA